MKCTNEGTRITFTFEGLDPVVFDAERANNLTQRAAMHGFEQKIRDNAAIPRKAKDGSVITVTEAMRRAAVEEMVNHLHANGEWNMKATRTAPQNPAILAMATRLGKTYAETEAIIANGNLAELMA